MQTLQQIYEETKRALTPFELFQLATLLLNDIPPRSFVDYSTEWSDRDLSDFRRSGEQHLLTRLEVPVHPR